jgi:hypothetical protein
MGEYKALAIVLVPPFIDRMATVMGEGTQPPKPQIRSAWFLPWLKHRGFPRRIR